MNEPMDPWSQAAIEQNRRWLTAFVLSLTGDAAACDDIVQEVFLIAYRKRSSFAPGTNFGGWLRGIARHVVLRHCERRAKQPLVNHDEALRRLEVAAAESEARSMDLGYQQQRYRFMRECLTTLSTRIRHVLRMRYTVGLQAGDIAREMGMTVSAVNVGVFRARLALAACIRRKESKAEIV